MSDQQFLPYDPTDPAEIGPPPRGDPERVLPKYLRARELKGRLARVKSEMLAEAAKPHPRTCPVHGCHNPATHEHHIAPRAIFGAEADHWPTIWLCKPHHDHYHNALVAYFYDLFRDQIEADIRYELGTPQ